MAQSMRMIKPSDVVETDVWVHHGIEGGERKGYRSLRQACRSTHSTRRLLRMLSSSWLLNPSFVSTVVAVVVVVVSLTRVYDDEDLLALLIMNV